MNDTSCVQTERINDLESGMKGIWEEQKKTNKQLEQITNLLIQYARVDEKLKDISNKATDHESRLRVLEQSDQRQGTELKTLIKWGWVIASSVIGFGFSFLAARWF